MNKKGKFRRVRLSLLFASVVFLIMFAATLFVLCGAAIMDHFGLLSQEISGRVPLFYFGVVSLIVGTVIAFMFSGKPLKGLRNIIVSWATLFSKSGDTLPIITYRIICRL